MSMKATSQSESTGMEPPPVPLRARVTGTLLITIMLPLFMLYCAIRKLLGITSYPFKTELLLTFSRNSDLLPLSCRRGVQHVDQISLVGQSRRFSEVASTLCERVSRPNFSGYWVCRGSVRKAQTQHPSQSDVTVMWIHGGSYNSGHALNNLPHNLRIAELVIEEGLSINIFALKYDLAPEACFPTQVDQALVAYRYLVDEMGIEPNRIIVIGGSSGAHLALSLLYGLAEKGIPRPGKAMLLYPWVNLNNSGASFRHNKYKDALSKRGLDTAATWVIGKGGRSKFPHLIDFTSSPSSRHHSWSRFLPPTWVWIGSHDVFLADVSKFVDKARADGVVVEFHIEDGMPHGWLEYQDSMAAKRYLEAGPLEDVLSIMLGAEVLARVMCDHARAVCGRI